MDRRDFLKKGALTLAGAVVGGGIISALVGSEGCASPPPTKRIGLQLYSLRDAMAQDPAGTLKKIAAMGYAELETASYDDGKIYGHTPAEFRALVEGLGMKVTSAHIGGGEPRSDEWWSRAIADHKAMGCRYVVIPSIALGETPAELDALCEYFNRVAALAKTEGLTLGYHNHSGEFGEIEGTTIFDRMLTSTSSDVVYELDVYWVARGGKDPVDYLNRYPGRFPVLHIKDESIIGNSGTLDFGSIFAAAYARGMKDFFVEVERYELPAEICVEKSFDFLNVAPFVKSI
ncbi:MAG: sugar phosphate isomerase/epimerase [Alistipes sp.]|jgi:sugar phosphate isomerase/epimerase|nr:sugar phosphate isomerase/epimerase [Alistipes sp.]